jgi:hypothetical protein
MTKTHSLERGHHKGDTKPHGGGERIDYTFISRRNDKER